MTGTALEAAPPPSASRAAAADAPLIFSAPMVRALTMGAKTETRRLAAMKRAAAIRPGSLVWVREAFRLEDGFDAAGPKVMESTSFTEMPVWHEADCGAPDPKRTRSRWGRAFGRCRSPIHMPRWASRLTLRVIEARIEPLHAIDDAGAAAEGITRLPWDIAGAARYGAELERGAWTAVAPSPRESYALFWDELHGRSDGARWGANPTVVVIRFEVIAKNIAAVLAAEFRR